MTDKQPEALRQAAWLKKEGASCQRHCDLGVLIERQHAELETLRAGYAAARLEIESLKAQLAERAREHADELAVAYMCGASREKELAAQQPGAAGLIGALEDAQRAINSMKVEAETAAQGDEQMMLEACETISNEGLQADMAIRAALASHGQAPAQAASSAVLKAIREANMQLVRTGDDAFMLVPYKVATAQAAESVPALQGETNAQLDTDSNPTAPGQQRDMACSLALGQPVGNGSDQVAGHPSAQGNKLLTVAERYLRSFLRSATFKSESDREAALNCVEVLWEAARAPAESVQEDAARYRFLRDGEWRDTDLEPFIRLQLNMLWDAKIDAARAAQEGK